MFRTMLIAAATSSMAAANSASDSTVELRCRSCKVTQTVRREDKGAHRECPYCGAFYDAELENALGVTTAFRSASARSLRFVTDMTISKSITVETGFAIQIQIEICS